MTCQCITCLKRRRRATNWRRKKRGLSPLPPLKARPRFYGECQCHGCQVAREACKRRYYSSVSKREVSDQELDRRAAEWLSALP